MNIRSTLWRQRRLAVLILLSASLLRCTPQPTPTPTLAPVAPATTAPLPSVAVAATATAAPTAAAPASWTDSSRFAQALRPETQGDLAAAAPPLHYQIVLRLDLAERQISGQQWIRFTNNSPGPLTTVTLRLYPNLGRTEKVLRVANLLVNGAPAAARPAALDSALVISLTEALAPGASLELSMDFTANLPNEGGGNYSTFGYASGVLALAQFYPTIPRIGSAGWDLETPPLFGDLTTADPGLYDVWVTAPADLTLVATGVTSETTHNADGSQTQHIVGGPQREFNLTAGHDFVRQSGQVGNVTINSYFTKGNEASGQAALDWASQAFDIYQRAFGAYPYSELDIVATPTDAGGVEYPGLVVIADRLYEDAPEPFTFFQIAVVHEAAHQWWYNLVGNDQLRQPWLDEATTQYATVLFFEDRYGTNGRAGVIESFQARWDRVKASNDQAVGLPVAAYDGRGYGAIVYGKGPLFLLALRDEMGGATFDRFMQDFATAQRWRTATTADFLTAAETACNCQLDDLFAEWVMPE